jgi:hypothetical protein
VQSPPHQAVGAGRGLAPGTLARAHVVRTSAVERPTLAARAGLAQRVVTIRQTSYGVVLSQMISNTLVPQLKRL